MHRSAGIHYLNFLINCSVYLFLSVDNFKNNQNNTSISQDYTTIFVEDEKIEGFFPRVTQLVSVVMLLVSKTPELTGCVLEINTGQFNHECINVLRACT